MRRFLLLLALVVATMIAVPSAQAIVAPINCGMTTVKGQRYQIKADQLKCSTAKPHARRYLSTGRKPSGYRCKNFRASDTALKFSCKRGVRDFRAIRR